MSNFTNTQKIKVCIFPECGKRMKVRGYCEIHYDQLRTTGEVFKINSRQRRKGSPPRIICDEVTCNNHDLFGPCYVFRGAKSRDGYGQVRIGDKRVYVHRYCWEKEIGPIQEGMVLDHQCRNRGCCNVDHLRVVTAYINNTENTVHSIRRLKNSRAGLTPDSAAP